MHCAARTSMALTLVALMLVMAAATALPEARDRVHANPSTAPPGPLGAEARAPPRGPYRTAHHNVYIGGFIVRLYVTPL